MKIVTIIKVNAAALLLLLLAYLCLWFGLCLLQASLQGVHVAQLVAQRLQEAFVVLRQHERHRELNDSGARPQRIPLDARVAYLDAEQHLGRADLGLLEVVLLEDGVQQGGVLVELGRVLVPEVGGRQQQTVVLGKQLLG